MDQGSTEPHLLLHPSRELSRRTIGERSESCRIEQFFDLSRALARREAKKLRHEVYVVVDAELQVQVLAEALRHVRDSGAHGAPVPHLPHVAAERVDLSPLYLL